MENNKHPTFANGKICYIEIPAIDINISASFYKEVFGWHIRNDGDGIIAFDDAAGEVSGTWVTGRKPTSEIGFMIHLMVYNMPETIDLIISRDGKILEQPDMSLQEVTAKFSDPAGNIWGLYQQTLQK